MVEHIKREYNETEEHVAPLTPKSTPEKSSGKRLSDEASSGDSSPVSSPSKKRVKQNKTSTSTSKSKKRSTLPSCYEELSESDKLLLKLKDENKTWKEICIAVEKLTGEKTTASVLRPRQWRLKANIMVMSDEDQQRLLASKEIVDMRIEKERWNMIAEEMQKQGSEKYTGAAAEKQFKKMMKPDHPVV